ncbi:MAG: serine hydrolase domain-containing protein [Polyangiales bacterium]
MGRHLWIVLLAAGCGSSSSAPAESPGDSGVVEETSTDAPAEEVAPTACDLRDQKLQAALDGAHKKSPNAMLAVKDEACGVRVLVSSDMANATKDSLWRIGSVTKTFTSAVILSLEAEGKVALTDPLSKWIDMVPKTDGVTVRMLLNHTSGIFNYTEDPAFLVDRTTKRTPREIVDFATTHDPYFAPGTDWHYSNTNYILLGMIAEKAGGAKISALIRARALTKAGLSHTFFDGEETVMGTMAKGFTGTKDVTFLNDMSWPWAAGAMVATGADLVTWASAYYGTDLVLDATRRAEISAMPVNMGGYGLGAFLLTDAMTGGAGPAIGHGGDIDGFHTQLFFLPDKKLSFATTVNKDGASPNDIAIAVLPVLFP